MNEFALIDERDAVTLVRDLPGPIERVWAFLTDPKLLSLWFSDGMIADHVGGEMSFEMGASGRVTAYEPPQLLEYTWNEPDLSRGIVDALVRWELAEVGERVRVTLTHQRLSQREALEHSAGWHTFLDRLCASVDGREPPELMVRFAQLKSEYGKRHNIALDTL